VIVPAKPDLIVFLCPNGHRLNGPSSLEGKPGQCPHCGVKFRVPTRDDPVEEEDHEPPLASPGSGTGIQALDTVQELPGEDSAWNVPVDELPGAGFLGSPPSLAPAAPGSGTGSGIVGRSFPMAEAFLRLWNERDRNCVIELHLASGQILVPEKFSRESTRRGYGVFAFKDPDGSYTITAIPWDGLARVTMRRLGKLPKRLFE
jgi:hypothetical protein